MAKREYPEIQKEFGEHLQKLRKSKGISLRLLASRCDLDDSNISKIENGHFNVQLSTILELAKGLDVPKKELLDY
ncbi:helix-turn-helix protein [Arcticibacter tournemirensis]|uniref:Helix-turn-helix transcriptional regulator n=1 Tax=Arcticibacter tournemirensis TaxID=699437 RepID=A0A5M9GSH2_9SPHI|nr:helix-turn-helix transcriptional regulator [Arcticibacter tournemirensis]KAA8475688.1 helix-turn-helix transcriptional regulator [Arcticibacter tournemirensis]TQM50769.1 helix-turn-helix protein [Arcticibacter tournemirensis]